MNKLKTFLFISILAYLGLCSRKKLPLQPGSELGKETIKENTLPTIERVYTLYDYDRHIDDYDPSTADYQDEIIIEFSEPMDENSVLNAVSMLVVGGRASSIPRGKWVYEKESNRLRYILDSGAGYAESTKYEIRITSEATDLSGNPLDGNGNGFAEGSLDDYYITLWTDKGNTISDPDRDPPSFYIFNNLISPNPWALGGLVGTTDSIHVRFYTTDIDENTVQSAFRLTKYETGEQVSLGTPKIKVDTISHTTDIIFSGFGLNYKTVYKLEILTSLKDTAGNSLDGNGNGVSEMEDLDKVEILFATVKNADGDMTEFPTYMDYERNGNVIFIWFDKIMDESTLNNTNVKIFRSYLQDAVPFNMRIHQNYEEGRTYLEITLLAHKFEPVYVWISRNVKDTQGLKLDANGDNIGGIEGEDNEIFLVP